MARRLKKEEIARTAQRLFSRDGYEASSLAKLALDLKVAKGTLHYHWPRKGDLLAYLIGDFVGGIHHRLSEVARSNAPPYEKLRACVEIHMSTLLTDYDAAYIFFEERRHLTKGPATKLLKIDRDIRSIYRRILEECGQQGICRQRYEFGDMHILALMNWTYRWYRNATDDAKKHALIQEVMRFIDHAFDVTIPNSPLADTPIKNTP